MTALKSVTPVEAKRWIDEGRAVLIDIRERDEHARESIDAACLSSLSCFVPAEVSGDRGKIAIFHCKSGMRTQTNARRLAECGFADAYYLAGGIEAWKRAGYPVRTTG